MSVDKRQKAPGLGIAVYVLALGTFLMLTTEFVIAGVLPEMAADLNVSLASVGLLITVFALGMIVGAPIVALLTLRLSKRGVLVLAMVIFVIGHIAVATASSFAVIFIARFITALGTGAFWAVASVVATRMAGPSRGARAMAIINAGGSLATVLGVPIGALIAQQFGWRGTFWTLAVAATLATFLVWKLVPSEAPDLSSTTVAIELKALRSIRLWLALLACATTTGGVITAYSFIHPLLTDQAGVPGNLVPYVLTGFGIGSLIGTLIGGRLGDRWPFWVTITTPAVSAVLLTVIALLHQQPWTTTFLFVILGLFGLSANGILVHLAVDFAKRGAVLGSALTVSFFNVGTAIGTAIAGPTLTSSLGVTGPVVVGIFVVSLTIIPTTILALMARRERMARI